MWCDPRVFVTLLISRVVDPDWWQKIAFAPLAAVESIYHQKG
jgi:hypothetical protein